MPGCRGSAAAGRPAPGGHPHTCSRAWESAATNRTTSALGRCARSLCAVLVAQPVRLPEQVRENVAADIIEHPLGLGHGCGSTLGRS